MTKPVIKKLSRFRLMSNCMTIMNIHDILNNRIGLYGYENITNAESLISYMESQADRETAVVFNTDVDVSYVVIDAELIYNSFHLKSAIYKAHLNESQSSMKTKSILTEVIYYLSPSTKINDSIAQYKIKPSSTMILILSAPKLSSVDLFFTASIEGSQFDIDQLDNAKNLHIKRNKLIQYFHVLPSELEIDSLENCIATRVASKDI